MKRAVMFWEDKLVNTLAAKASLAKAAIVTAALATALTAGAGAAWAHHSVAMFDNTKTVNYEGVVNRWQYTNPHTWLYIDVTDAQGAKSTWGFEADGPSTLLRLGIKKTSFVLGEKVTVTAHPMRDGSKAGMWLRVRKADGQVISKEALAGSVQGR